MLGGLHEDTQPWSGGLGLCSGSTCHTGSTRGALLTDTDPAGVCTVGQWDGCDSPGSGLSGSRPADTGSSLPPAIPGRCGKPRSPASAARRCRSSVSPGRPSRLALGLPALLAKTSVVPDMSTFTGSPERGGAWVAAPPPAVFRVLANSPEQKLRQAVPVCGHGPAFRHGKPCDLASGSLLPQGC